MSRQDEHLARLRNGLAQGKTSKVCESLTVEQLRAALPEAKEATDNYLRRLQHRLVKEKLAEENDQLISQVAGRLPAPLRDAEPTVTRLAGRRALIIWLEPAVQKHPMSIRT